MDTVICYQYDHFVRPANRIPNNWVHNHHLFSFACVHIIVLQSDNVLLHEPRLSQSVFEFISVLQTIQRDPTDQHRRRPNRCYSEQWSHIVKSDTDAQGVGKLCMYIGDTDLINRKRFSHTTQTPSRQRINVISHLTDKRFKYDSLKRINIQAKIFATDAKRTIRPKINAWYVLALEKVSTVSVVENRDLLGLSMLLEF